LEAFGEAGDPFNPHIHEALLHAHAEGIDGPTCVEILQPGYRIGDRILRPARVAVAEPEPDAPAAIAEPVEATQQGSPEEPSSGPAREPGEDESAANDNQS
jgi:molecular chaperone GrpE